MQSTRTFNPATDLGIELDGPVAAGTKLITMDFYGYSWSRTND